MTLRRGFKAESNWYAREFRKELSLDVADPLCPWELAKLLEVPVYKLSDLGTNSPAFRYLMHGAGKEFFSAVTVFLGKHRVIMHHDGNHPVRQASDISHELAHGILGHPPMPPFNEKGERTYNKELEEEASWLGPALLISEEAAVKIVKSGVPIAIAAKRYKVSEKLLRMRINVTGARRRI
jgi:hypothetical protein